MTWQLIASAPKDEPVFVYRPGDDRGYMAKYVTGTKGGGNVKVGWRFYYEPYYTSYSAKMPTHWMPLPSPPNPPA